MKFVFLHGLGQTAQDWQAVIHQSSLFDVDCPELFSFAENAFTYSGILSGLEHFYANASEPFVLCGLSLGALLALDYTIRHPEQISSLILVGAQYKVPTRLIDFQNLIFRCMPENAFTDMGLSKHDTLKLSHSMRMLDFSPKLSEIHCPVSVICGKKDRANLKAAKQLHALLPQSHLHIIPGAGHEVNKDAPKALAALIENCI